MNIEDLKYVMGRIEKKVAEITMLCNSCIASWKNDGKVEISAFFYEEKILFPGQMQKGNSTFFIYTERIFCKLFTSMQLKSDI